VIRRDVMARIAVLLAVLGVGLLVSAGATTYLVRPDGTGDFPTIQAAVNAAASGDAIELADGVFTGDGNHDINYLGRAITVRSLNADPELVAIDCQGSPGDPHRGFIFQTGEGAGSVLECVTVENAYSTGDGGGMYCSGASPTVSRCLIRNCHAGNGGGASCWNSSVTLTDCVFAGNTAGAGGGASFWYCASAPYPILTRCSFLSNSSSGEGGALFYFACHSTVASSTLFDSGSFYDAVSLVHRSVVSLDNTIIAFGNQGAAIYVEGGGAEAILGCCDIYGNAGGDWTGSIAGQLGTNGNFSADPCFCDPGNGDLHLWDYSPCAPFTPPHEECDLIGAWPVACWDAQGTVDSDASQAAQQRMLGVSASPNPFSGTTRISFASSTPGAVRVGVFDMAGREVRSLVVDGAGRSSSSLTWDGRDHAGLLVPAGVYWVRASQGGREAATRVIVLR
jgi:hypothetical protein